MRVFYLLFIGLVLVGCKHGPNNTDDLAGSYSGVFEYGNFLDTIQFKIEQDSLDWKVFFTSLEQNANGIPFHYIEVDGDSIHFMLQSDFYRYTFKNKWRKDHSKLEGTLKVDSLEVRYILEKKPADQFDNVKKEEVQFVSNGLHINGTIWYPKKSGNKGMVIVSSSGQEDRSASRAEAILFAQNGYTVFHYDKRGTGTSEGTWVTTSMEELLLDDSNAITYFSSKTGIPLSNIGVKGSSQGATKVPYLLNKLEDLKYGIVVSCPGTTLLESDLNYWKNRNSSLFGNDIDAAMALQRNVFEHMAGILSRSKLEQIIEQNRSKTWFTNIWIPNLDGVQIDSKLLYSPLPYFEKVKQPILILQGTLDEIIPSNSYKALSNSLKVAKNNDFDIVLLEGASHSMYNMGESDFPYWSKLHSKYMETINEWIKGVTAKP